MTDKIKSIIAVYLAITACCLAIASMKEGDYRSQASRLDQKVMILELKDQPAIITRMGIRRNQARAKAEQMEVAVLLFVMALAVASPALIAGVAGAWMLLGTSWLASSAAVYCAWLAVG